MSVAFGAGWTPCLGPILGAILTYTAATADLSRGLPLLLAYSLGLALPFLLAAVAVERFLEAVTRLRPHLARVSAGERSVVDHRRRVDDVRLLYRARDLHADDHASSAEEAALMSSRDARSQDKLCPSHSFASLSSSRVGTGLSSTSAHPSSRHRAAISGSSRPVSATISLGEMPRSRI